MSSIDIVGFDLDGTLVDTSGDLTAATNHALTLAGRPTLGTDQVKGMIGLGAKYMLERGLAETGGIAPEEFRPLYKALLHFYTENVAVHSRPYPGALELLDALDARGIAYAVVTNKFESLACKLLDALGLSPRLACIIGGDTLGPGRSKPAPDPIHEMCVRADRNHPLYVGDTIYDVQAGRAAGAVTVAVSFGFLHQPIDTMGAHHVIHHFDELLPLIDRL